MEDFEGNKINAKKEIANTAPGQRRITHTEFLIGKSVLGVA